ncbi:stalk domain-containing protein [Paenibacillus sp. J5C_2022]|uniref:stalk domain-containing protein n=1 Tax=Paenibacillus sp. J5C2022 TaxID=2977129 RepID=UPI0021CF18F0|nr:stalk domain-containing protein [Paenibacillus sp. J5C2022]MCU6709186.1 stalk domain-containing protein [Paenibacillus sp. J5C2022]
MIRKFRNFTLAASASVILATSVHTSGIAAATAQPVTGQADELREEYRIVALGDSLAAGYEHGFDLESVPYGFVEHVYEQALFQGERAIYSNYGVLGLRTDGLEKWLSLAEASETAEAELIQADLPDPRAEVIFGQTPQLREDIESADLILVSIGSNDFSSLIKELGEEAVYEELADAEQEALLAGLQDSLDAFEASLSEALQTIVALNDEAKIVVSNQYLPIPFIKARGERNYLIDQSTAQFLVDGQTQIHERLNHVAEELLAEGHNVAIVDAATAIEKSILGFTSVKEGDTHPTREGYEALGKAFSQLLWGEYREMQDRAEGVPISVVVNGTEVLTDYAPVIIKGRTFLAIRDITDAMGAALKWDPETDTAIISLADRQVELTIGADTIVVNGEQLPLGAEPAFLKQFPGEKKTYVPLAALSDGLGFQVVYRAEMKAAFINE